MTLRNLAVGGWTIGERAEVQGRVNDAIRAGLVTFDTNILLDLYALDELDLRSIFASLSGQLKPRLWLTHQVATEYTRNRTGRIRPKKKELVTFLSTAEGLRKSVADSILQPLKNQRIVDDAMAAALPDWYGPLGMWLQPHLAAAQAKVSRFEQLEDVEQDTILDRLSDLFGDRVTAPLLTGELTTLLHNGDLRYRYKIPPGYADAKPLEKRTIDDYGDLLLWEQLIVLSSNTEVPAILLVTRDNGKGDWVEDLPAEPGLPKERVLRRDLALEFRSRTGKDLAVLDLTEFLSAAQRLGVLAPVPREDMGHLHRKILEQDAERLRGVLQMRQQDLMNAMNGEVQSRMALKALDAYWMDIDQFEAPDVNAAFHSYNVRREQLLKSRTSHESLSRSAIEDVARIELRLREINSQLQDQERQVQ